MLDFILNLFKTDKKTKKSNGSITVEQIIDECSKNAIDITLYTDIKPGKFHYGNQMVSFRCSKCNKHHQKGFKSFTSEQFKCECKDIKKEPKKQSNEYYLYCLKKQGEDVAKIGITSNIVSRLSGNYNGKQYDGLISLNIDIDKSFYIKTKNEEIAKKLENKFISFHSSKNTEIGDISGKTEWFIDGEKFQSSVKKYLTKAEYELIPISNAFRQ